MGGISSALEFCQEDIFVQLRYAYVSSDLIENILQKKVEYRINVVRFGEKIYPVLGIYPFSILNDLKKPSKTETSEYDFWNNKTLIT
jgi:molybdopterin-guanine dinucleotide biosynthesis protein A